MGWRNLPSLSALRAFEAAGRTGSLSKAAAELNVTHAAIAQHVRSVEDVIGDPLLVRSGRGMALTPAGEVYHPALSEAFAQIARATQEARSRREAGPLTLTVTPGFAANWLMPRLCDFWARHPDIKVSVTPASEVVDLRRDPYDLAIRYGTGDWPGLESEPLVAVENVVVAAPALLGGRGATSMAELADLTWIFETTQDEQLLWATQNGLDPDRSRIERVATIELVTAAAKAGAGVAVLPASFLTDDLKEGRLRQVLSLPPTDVAYYMVTRPGVRSDRLKTLIRWLKSVA